MAGKTPWTRGLRWEEMYNADVLQRQQATRSARNQCDSTYELAFVVWALDHEIPFERNLGFFPYEYQGKVMRWMPDFVLSDGTFIEKGVSY
jgi:hypothetical protein